MEESYHSVAIAQIQKHFWKIATHIVHKLNSFIGKAFTQTMLCRHWRNIIGGKETEFLERSCS